MFISWNHKSTPNKEELSGGLPASKKVEAPAHQEAAHADTTGHDMMPTEAPAHEAAPAEAHAPAAH
jgi:hypothetical protein